MLCTNSRFNDERAVHIVAYRSLLTYSHCSDVNGMYGGMM